MVPSIWGWVEVLPRSLRSAAAKGAAAPVPSASLRAGGMTAFGEGEEAKKGP